jgi:putative oxidoreductase
VIKDLEVRRMAYGLLLLRVVVGGIFVGHGTQKLLGWWNGPGPAGTTGWLAGIGFRPAAPLALLVGATETTGLLFALGLLTPLASAAIAGVMLVAIGAVHWKNGFWNTNQGYEFNLTLLAVATAVAATGPGRFSVDRAIGWDASLSGLWWALGVLVVAAAGAAVVLTVFRAAQPAQRPAEQRGSLGRAA